MSLQILLSLILMSPKLRYCFLMGLNGLIFIEIGSVTCKICIQSQKFLLFRGGGEGQEGGV